MRISECDVSGQPRRACSYLVIRNVDLLFSRALLGDRLDEETGLAEIELIVEGESLRIVGEDNVLRPAVRSLEA